MYSSILLISVEMLQARLVIKTYIHYISYIITALHHGETNRFVYVVQNYTHLYFICDLDMVKIIFFKEKSVVHRYKWTPFVRNA